MSTTVKWMPVLSLAATIAFSADKKAHLFAQESYRGGIGASRIEQLPPPVRPDADTSTDTYGSRPAPRSSDRPYLGITFDPRYPDAAVARSVVPGGPADQAGIQAGDTIEAINDYPVSSYRDAYEIVDALGPGEIVDIDFSRRITGRTQAVLGGDPTDEASTANYAEEPRRSPYPERPASTYAEEPLPDPRYDSRARRSIDLRFNGASSDRELNYNGASPQRVDAPAARRPSERSRVRERGLRTLLPWRRR